MRNVDPAEQTSFLDHAYLERECKPNSSVVDEYRKMFESRISAGETEKVARFLESTWTSDSVTTWWDTQKKLKGLHTFYIEQL